MQLDKLTQEKVEAFHKLLGARFRSIEVASPDAPITVLATDLEDQQYYVRIEMLEGSVDDISSTGIKIENVIFYQLAQLMQSENNVFIMVIFKDGFVMWFLNEVSGEQMKVTDENVLIGITSALHVENANDAKYKPVTLSSADGKSIYVLKKD
jgi:hypothetical protein